MTPKCDMQRDCTEPIAYLDASGYIYCTQHGLNRQAWKRCRKLRPYELNKILRGEPLERY